MSQAVLKEEARKMWNECFLRTTAFCAQALQKNQAAQRAKASISKQMKQASMVASGYVIGQFVSFTTQRAIRKNVAVPMQGMMYAAVSCLQYLSDAQSLASFAEEI